MSHGHRIIQEQHSHDEALRERSEESTEDRQCRGRLFVELLELSLAELLQVVERPQRSGGHDGEGRRAKTARELMNHLVIMVDESFD